MPTTRTGSSLTSSPIWWSSTRTGNTLSVFRRRRRHRVSHGPARPDPARPHTLHRKPQQSCGGPVGQAGHHHVDDDSFIDDLTLRNAIGATDPKETQADQWAGEAFVYVDYGVPKDDIRDRVHGVRGKRFLGYEVEHEEDVQESALPGGWVPHVTPSEAVRAVRGYQCFANIRPFAWYVVLRREKDRDHAHGPARLALLFVGGDGFATCDALYSRLLQKPRLNLRVRRGA